MFDAASARLAVHNARHLLAPRCNLLPSRACLGPVLGAGGPPAPLHRSTEAIVALAALPWAIAVPFSLAIAWHAHRVGDQSIHMAVLYVSAGTCLCGCALQQNRSSISVRLRTGWKPGQACAPSIITPCSAVCSCASLTTWLEARPACAPVTSDAAAVPAQQLGSLASLGITC